MVERQLPKLDTGVRFPSPADYLAAQKRRLRLALQKCLELRADRANNQSGSEEQQR
jgi:hypothetical protein